MMNVKKDEERRQETDVSRREFVALTLAAGLATTTHPALAAELPVIESDIEIKTTDGTCDAVFFHPTTGAHPGVLVWPDSNGLRPAFRVIGKRLAAEGYSVLVPNHLYRAPRRPCSTRRSTP